MQLGRLGDQQLSILDGPAPSNPDELKAEHWSNFQEFIGKLQKLEKQLTTQWEEIGQIPDDKGGRDKTELTGKLEDSVISTTSYVMHNTIYKVMLHLYIYVPSIYTIYIIHTYDA